MSKSTLDYTNIITLDKALLITRSSLKVMVEGGGDCYVNVYMIVDQLVLKTKKYFCDRKNLQLSEIGLLQSSMFLKKKKTTFIWNTFRKV